VELVGIWGRRPEEARRLAAALDATAYVDYAVMLENVDAVAFAVPPDIQVDMAGEAASAGKHLLLDKPVAIDAVAAQGLADTAQHNGIASVVFFTDRFIDASRVWFDRVREVDGWRGGWMRWLSSLQESGNPFGASVWRQERGAVWDTGPHALSTLSAALGPVESLVAVAGAGDLVTLTLSHQSGATSTATLSQFAPPAAVSFEAAVWGREGVWVMPARPENSQVNAMRDAAQELVAAARSGQPHEVDVAFGARVVELLADAQAQVDTQRAGRASD
jgi:predicted dehydrogenase